jgi:hypothetical protein
MTETTTTIDISKIQVENVLQAVLKDVLEVVPQSRVAYASQVVQDLWDWAEENQLREVFYLLIQVAKELLDSKLVCSFFPAAGLVSKILSTIISILGSGDSGSKDIVPSLNVVAENLRAELELEAKASRKHS